MGQAPEKMSLARRSSRRRSTMSLSDVQEGVVMGSRHHQQLLPNTSPPRINVISPGGGSAATTPSPTSQHHRSRNDSTSSTTDILASASGSGIGDGQGLSPFRLAQRIIDDNFRHESFEIHESALGGGGGVTRRGSFLNLTDNARRRLSNVGDAVSRRISRTIGWKSTNTEAIVEQGVALCKHYVRNRLKRSGLLTRKIGLKRSASSKLVVESPAATAASANAAPVLWPAHQMYPELATLGAELEKMYPELYDRVGRQIGRVQFTSKQRVCDALADIVREIMQNGNCSWSKIVAVYAIAGGLACDCVRQGNPDFLEAIYEAMENIIEEYLASWISLRGGWSDLSVRCKSTPAWDPEKSTYLITIGLMMLIVTVVIFLLVLIVRLFLL